MKIIIISILILFHSASIFSQKKVLYFKEFKPDYIDIKYSKKQIVDDLNFLIKTVKTLHPNFYHNFTEEQLQKSVDSITVLIEDSINIYESSLLLSSVIALLNEGHLGLLINSETIKFYESYKSKFPYKIYRLTDSAIVIKNDLSSSPMLNNYDSIIKINDIPVYTIISQFKKYYGGMNEWREQMIISTFGYLLFASNIKYPYKINAIQNGKSIEFFSDGISKIRYNPEKKHYKSKNFTYKIENDIAYMNFHSMNGEYQVFKDSLAIIFKILNKQGVQNLIVDLRENGGGTSYFGEYFLTYITDKPFRLSSSITTKITKPVRQYFGESLPLFLQIWSSFYSEGYIKTVNIKKEIHKISEPFFKGKICVLIGRNTFSSANLLADAIKENNLATLIGEPTAEPCNDFSNFIVFMLPNTQLITWAPIKQNVRSNGNKDDYSSVIPDIIIKESSKNKAEVYKEDEVLNFAKKWIINQ